MTAPLPFKLLHRTAKGTSGLQKKHNFFRKQKSVDTIVEVEKDDEPKSINLPRRSININKIPGVKTSKKLTGKFKNMTIEKGMHLRRVLTLRKQHFEFVKYDLHEITRVPSRDTVSPIEKSFHNILNEMIIETHNKDIFPETAKSMEQHSKSSFTRFPHNRSRLSSTKSNIINIRQRTLSADGGLLRYDGSDAISRKKKRGWPKINLRSVRDRTERVERKFIEGKGYQYYLAKYNEANANEVSYSSPAHFDTQYPTNPLHKRTFEAGTSTQRTDTNTSNSSESGYFTSSDVDELLHDSTEYSLDDTLMSLDLDDMLPKD